MANLILKNRSIKPLTLNESVDEKGHKKYVFEGVFTPCGIKNRNQRIYDEKEVLPHLAYLRDKIKKEGCILGELDHPEGRFEIYLHEASHKITDLWYDQQKHAVMGKLELLDTPNGKTMQAMVDAGCPLYVSSRAAGTVNPDSHVSIQQIFTYDLVATPGFEQCKLDEVNESMKPIVTSFINESINAKKSPNVASKYGIYNELTEIIETNEVPEINESINNNINMNDLTHRIDEDIQVKVTPEKAKELGLTNNDQNSANIDNTQNTEEKHSANEILDISPNYAEASDIEAIQPEFGTEPEDTEENNSIPTGGTESNSNDEQNPFLESAKPKKGKDLNKEEKKAKKENDADANDVEQQVEDGSIEDISEENKKVKANTVKDQKLNSKEDIKQKSIKEKDKKLDETISKRLNNKVKNIQESTKNLTDFYTDLINEDYRKKKIHNEIISNYPFAISLSESNFNKFANLLDEDKNKVAEYIYMHGITDIKSINEQFLRPIDDRINETKNYLKLADKSDLDLYRNATTEQRKSIDALADMYILESKADVDEFWRLSGIRESVQSQVKNQDFVNNINKSVTGGNDEDKIYETQLGYIKEIGNMM